MPGYAITYAQHAAENAAVRAEYEATRAVGLPTRLIDDLAAPFPVHGGVRLAEQAQVDPVAVLAALAADIESHGSQIFESTRAQRLQRCRGGVVVTTDHGEVSAKYAIVATGSPIFDRGGLAGQLVAQRSYLAAFEVPGPVAQEMFISAGRPIRSMRWCPTNNGEVLLVGGNGHDVGRAASEADHVAQLLDWANRWFPGASLRERWSAQDYHPITELPTVGTVRPGAENVLCASGFAKWGMTNGVAAALALSGRVNGRRPGWAHVYEGWRTGPVKSLCAGVQANAAVVGHLTTGWLRSTAAADGAASVSAEIPSVGGVADQPAFQQNLRPFGALAALVLRSAEELGHVVVARPFGVVGVLLHSQGVVERGFDEPDEVVVLVLGPGMPAGFIGRGPSQRCRQFAVQSLCGGFVTGVVGGRDVLTPLSDDVPGNHGFLLRRMLDPLTRPTGGHTVAVPRRPSSKQALAFTRARTRGPRSAAR